MNKPFFTGVCTALVTPFLNGKINYPMLNILLQRQMDAGIKAVVICGTTGESATLSDEEKLEMFQRAKAYVGNRMQIIAGTGCNDTNHTIKLSLAAQAVGADGLLIVSPYYNKASQQGLIAHYTAIANAVRIPVIVYNVPGRTGQDIPVDVYKELSSISNIVGIKEASTSITKIGKIRQQCPNLSIWSGNDDMTVPVISLGGHGVISVISNVVPEESILMTNAALAGDFDTAAAMHTQLLPFMELMFCEVNPIPVKAAMACIGYDCGECRMPLTPLSNENQIRMKHYFS